MKVTLLLIMLVYPVTSSVTTGSSSGSVTTWTTTAATAVQQYRKVSIPMPDLEACLKARRQFDDYQFTFAAACSAE